MPAEWWPLPRKYGLVRVGEVIETEHGPLVGNRFRCFLNGREVTNRCVAANDEEGWAELLLQNGPDGPGKTYVVWPKGSAEVGGIHYRTTETEGEARIAYACFHGRVVLVACP